MLQLASAHGATQSANLCLLSYQRGTMLVLVAAALFVTNGMFGVELPVLPIVTVALAWAAVWLATLKRLRRATPVSHAELLVQALIDVTALTALLYFTGGAVNPFAYALILFVLFGARALPARCAWVLAGVCIACYSLLQVAHVPLALPDDAAVERGLNYAAHWMIYAVLAGLACWFGVRFGELQNDHERHVRFGAEKDARERYLVGLATLAAGTAHEMNTPLSTMSVIVGDLRKEEHPPSDWKTSIEVLWLQIQSCRSSLLHMVREADPKRLGSTRALSAIELVESLAERLRLLRPQVQLSVDARTPRDTLLKCDATVEQALLSLLNNAADASPHDIELRTLERDNELQLDILDRGPGVPPDIRMRLGQPFAGSETRCNGCGLGIFVANTAIERFGGTVQIADRENGGTRVHVRLPAYREFAQEGAHA